MTAKLAWAASRAGITPGRASSSPSEAADSRLVGPLVSELPGDLLGIGANGQHQREPHDHEGPRGQPERRERVAVEIATRQQRTEHERAEQRPEDRAEENEGDAVRAPLRRVHVAGRRAREQCHATRGPHADQAEQHHRRRGGGAPERGARTPRDADAVPGRQYRNPAEAIHRPPRGQGRQGARRQDDRRAEAEQALHVEHQRKRQRRHRSRELEHRRGRREGGREEPRVAADRKRCRIGHAPRVPGAVRPRPRLSPRRRRSAPRPRPGRRGCG